MFLRNVRLVPVGGQATAVEPVNMRLSEDSIVAVGPEVIPAPGEEIIDAQGRWAIPGLWDQHVHMLQWSLMNVRVDTSGTSSPQDVVTRVRKFMSQVQPKAGHDIVVGFGHRNAEWTESPVTADLDRISADVPIILISGDAHSGWLNSAALHRLGLPYQDGPLTENDWFPVLSRLSSLPELVKQNDAAFASAVTAAHSRGVVGIVDLEFEVGFQEWIKRYERGVRSLRVRTAVYEDGLDAAIEAGMRTGQALPGTHGMIEMGSFKVISDGSLSTQTAYCFDAYTNVEHLAHSHGLPNQSFEHLTALMSRAKAHGLDIAMHAIGDRSISEAIEAFVQTGSRGTIEHVQMIRPEDIPRMAASGIVGSIQPAHLLDDRDMAHRCWADRTDRCYAFASLLRGGVPLVFGSDAPIAPLDPWLAMSAAVCRTNDERDQWNPEECLTVAEALAASTDQQNTLHAGGRPDVVLLDADPFAAQDDARATANHLKSMPVAATIVAGQVAWSGDAALTNVTDFSGARSSAA